MASPPLPLAAAPIRFGTDGWRGILGVDITVERLLPVAAASAQELAYQTGRARTADRRWHRSDCMRPRCWTTLADQLSRLPLLQLDRVERKPWGA